jgi:hypothetical protein
MCATFLVAKLEGRRSPGRQRRRYENNIKIYLKVIGLESVVSIHLAKDRDW